MFSCMMLLAFDSEQAGWIEWWRCEDVEEVVSFKDGCPLLHIGPLKQPWDFLHTVEP